MRQKPMTAAAARLLAVRRRPRGEWRSYPVWRRRPDPGVEVRWANDGDVQAPPDLALRWLRGAVLGDAPVDPAAVGRDLQPLTRDDHRLWIMAREGLARRSPFRRHHRRIPRHRRPVRVSRPVLCLASTIFAGRIASAILLPASVSLPHKNATQRMDAGRPLWEDESAWQHAERF